MSALFLSLAIAAFQNLLFRPSRWSLLLLCLALICLYPVTSVVLIVLGCCALVINQFT